VHSSGSRREVPGGAFRLQRPLARAEQSGWVAAAVFALSTGFFAFAYFTRKTPDAAAGFRSHRHSRTCRRCGSVTRWQAHRVANVHGLGALAAFGRCFTAEKVPARRGRFTILVPGWTTLSVFFRRRVKEGGLQRRTKYSANALRPMTMAATGARRVSSCTRRRVSGYRTLSHRCQRGAPTPATSLNSARHEITHRYPQFLPMGATSSIGSGARWKENTGIYAGSLDPKEKAA